MASPCLGGLTDEGTMISNLPLLFADGFPSCLETITEDQLEKFIPFMISCSLGAAVKNINDVAPQWWPDDLPYMLPLIRPNCLQTKWIAFLKSLVCRCYTYHGCEFMLRFCTELAKHDREYLRFENNDNLGTSSLYDMETGKLLVTIRNENRFYDKKKETPRKSLLPRAMPHASPSKVRASPLFPDVYLCDNCDAEFKSLAAVKNHETTCCQEPSETAMEPEISVEDMSLDQDKFLNYFDLQTPGNVGRTDYSPKKLQPLKFRSINSLRYATIPVSSPLGSLLCKKIRNSEAMLETLQERIERYCGVHSESTSRTRERNINEGWPVTWKHPKERGHSRNSWVHVYKFPSRHYKRIPSRGIGKVGKRKKRLKECRVVLKRLSKAEIAYHTSRSRNHSNVSGSVHLNNNNGTVVNRKTNFRSEISNRVDHVKHGNGKVFRRSEVTNSQSRHSVEKTRQHRKIDKTRSEQSSRKSRHGEVRVTTNGVSQDKNCELVDLTLSDDDPGEMADDESENSCDIIPFSFPQQVANIPNGHGDIPADFSKPVKDFVDLCSSDEESEINFDLSDCSESVPSVPTSEIVNKPHSELSSSFALARNEKHNESSTFMSHSRELLKLLSPHVSFFPSNNPDTYNMKACRTSSNNQITHGRVRVSTLENRPVMNNSIANGGIKQYKSVIKSEKRSGLRTRNCDDVSKVPRMPGFFTNGTGNSTSAKDKHTFAEGRPPWRAEELQKTYCILPHEN